MEKWPPEVAPSPEVAPLPPPLWCSGVLGEDETRWNGLGVGAGGLGTCDLWFGVLGERGCCCCCCCC